MDTIAKPQRKTARLTSIAENAKRAKQFQRTDYGGKDQIEVLYRYIEEEIESKGGKVGQNTKYLIAKAMQKLASKQVASCRKRTSGPLNEIIRLAGG